MFYQRSRSMEFTLGCGCHAPKAMMPGHPEDDGQPSLADGLAMENQWGAVHRLKNEDPEQFWGHEAAETPAEERREND